MRNLLILIALSTLVGCSFGARPTPAISLAPPASDLTLCPETLPPPASGKLPDLVANHVLTMRQYHRCMERHRGLVEWWEATDNALRPNNTLRPGP